MKPAPADRRQRRPDWAPALTLALLTLIAYLPALRGGFVWDDDLHVTANATLTTWGGLYDIWFGLWRHATCQYYPLTFSGFWLQYRLWGLQPLGYHLVNVLLHALNAILFWRLLRRFAFPEPAAPGAYSPTLASRLWPATPAFLAAALFAAHPVNVMSVAWITELKNGLAGLLMLATLLAFSRTLPDPRYARTTLPVLGLFALAMLAKTAALTLIPGALLWVWWRQPQRLGRAALRLLPCALFAAALTAITIHVEQGRVWGADPRPDFLFMERALVAGRSFWEYAWRLLWPFRLSFLYPAWVVDVQSPRHYLPLAALLVLLAALWHGRVRLGRGPFAAGLYFFLAAPALILGQTMYMMRYTPIADHWQYFAAPALFALAGAGLARLRPPRARAAATAALVLILATLTWRQCGMYRDEATLWTATLERHPRIWLAHNNLGVILQNQGRLNEATAHFQAALQADPGFAETYNNLGVIAYRQGRRPEALRWFREALDVHPAHVQAHGNLALLLAENGREAEAREHLAIALRLKPDAPELLRAKAYIDQQLQPR